MIINIKPLDTLFFRDGKPFNSGDDVWASGIFPPYPSVLYGALRTCYFSSNPEDIEKANTNQDPTKFLEIKKIQLKYGNDLLFPLPLDCVRTFENEKDNKKIATVLKLEENTCKSSLGTEYILHSDSKEDVKSINGGYIEMEDYCDYLAPKSEEYYYTDITEGVLSEAKVGIAINKKTGTVDFGKLYRLDMLRLANKDNSHDLSFQVEFDGLNLPGESGLMKLGAENKAAIYEVVTPSPPKITSIGFSKRFKLILTTPAIFNKGWLPDWIDEDSLTGSIGNIKLKLLTAAVGKNLNIGGWDMKNNQPKIMYKAVPAGSVYYFEILEGNQKNVIVQLHNKSISDQRANEGFGITYIGGINE